MFDLPRQDGSPEYIEHRKAVDDARVRYGLQVCPKPDAFSPMLLAMSQTALSILHHANRKKPHSGKLTPGVELDPLREALHVADPRVVRKGRVKIVRRRLERHHNIPRDPGAC